MYRTTYEDKDTDVILSNPNLATLQSMVAAAQAGFDAHGDLHINTRYSQERLGDGSIMHAAHIVRRVRIYE